MASLSAACLAPPFSQQLPHEETCFYEQMASPLMQASTTFVTSLAAVEETMPLLVDLLLWRFPACLRAEIAGQQKTEESIGFSLT